MSSSHFLIKAATCFILLSFFNSLTTTTAEPIFDTDGEPVNLNPGSQYYIAPVKWGAGGGVGYANTQDYHSRCPTFAVSQLDDNRCGTYYGNPINFQPVSFLDKENITDSTEVSIGFAGHPPRVPYGCDQPSMKWKMAKHGNQMSADIGMFHFGGLGAGDDESSAFKIAKNDAYGYRLTYCPPSTSGVKESASCGSLKPVFDRNFGFRRWVLTSDDDPFQVMFVKADGGRRPY